MRHLLQIYTRLSLTQLYAEFLDAVSNADLLSRKRSQRSRGLSLELQVQPKASSPLLTMALAWKTLSSAAWEALQIFLHTSFGVATAREARDQSLRLSMGSPYVRRDLNDRE